MHICVASLILISILLLERLTFEDEVSGSQAEERPKLKEPVQV